MRHGDGDVLVRDREKARHTTTRRPRLDERLDDRCEIRPRVGKDELDPAVDEGIEKRVRDPLAQRPFSLSGALANSLATAPSTLVPLKKSGFML